MSNNNTANNKRIAKNTLLLYMRMLFIMAVQLYTSRVVLNTLGVVDYGLYNVVGGIVTMFAFLNGAMVTSTQRYITFELGRKNIERLKVVFTTCVQIQLFISIAIVLLCETIGLWFFYEKMIIPENRLNAAFWVYQLSIFTMCIQVMSVPFNSDIIAHERMGAFAIISVAEVVLKLAVVFLLAIGDFDKLVFYAILIAIVQIFIQILYIRYCYTHFTESHLSRGYDKKLVNEIAKFMGWNVWGNLAGTLFGTGINLMLNVFFGPVVNAARAVAVQVETAVHQFSTNFMMAVNPQITKLYAQDNLPEMHQLLFRASKFSFFLLFALSLPVILETDFLLTLWLKNVPEYAVVFLRILLFIVIIDAVARPSMTAAAATGNVKLYQSLVGGILLTIVPIAYVVLKLDGPPYSVYLVHLIICIVAFVTRLLVVRKLISLSLRQYFREVILRCGYVLFISGVLAWLIRCNMPEGVLGALTVCILSSILVLSISYALGLTSSERSFIHQKCTEVIHRLH